MKPWPLNPAAHQKPSSSGTGPRIAWWSGVVSYNQAHAVLTPAPARAAARGADALDPPAADVRAGQLRSLLQAGAVPARRCCVTRGHVCRARDAVGGTERATEHIVHVEHGHHPCRLRRISPPRFGQADSAPHLHVVAEILDVLGQREDEEVADLAKVGRVAGF